MRRAPPQMPISPKVLTHIAGATLIITACLAMFADGENREAFASEVKKNEAHNREMAAKAREAERAQRRADKARSPGGAPLGKAGSSTRGMASSYDPYANVDPELVPEDPAEKELRLAEVDSGSSNPWGVKRTMPVTQLRAALPPSAIRPGTPGGPGGPPRIGRSQPSRAQVEAMIAASAARSGSDGRE